MKRQIILLTLFSFLISCSRTLEKFKAQEYYDKGEYEKAIEIYDKEIKKSPKDCELYQGRSECYRHLLNFEKVIPDLLQVVNLGCGSGGVYNNLGDAYFKLGKPDLAITYFKKAIDEKFQPGTVSANIGICYSTLGEPEMAEQFFKKAISIDPDTADNYYYLGVYLQQCDRLEEALLNINKAIELKPSFTEFYIKRGSIYGSLGDYENAIKEADKVLSMNPDKVQKQDALYIKVLSLINLNKTKEACQQLEKLKEVDRTVDYSEFKLGC